MLAVASAIAMAPAALAGELGGQVRDETGASLPGVSVSAVSRERGFTRTTASDPTGRFLFPEVPPGLYDVTASLADFATVIEKDNLVESSKRTDLSITMQLSRQKASVTVTGEVPIVDK